VIRGRHDYTPISDRPGCVAWQYLESHQFHVQRAVRNGDSWDPWNLPPDDYSIHGINALSSMAVTTMRRSYGQRANTPGMAYALFSFAERLQQQGEDPQLRARLMEEATWGLRWVLKTSFGDGYALPDN